MIASLTYSSFWPTSCKCLCRSLSAWRWRRARTTGAEAEQRPYKHYLAIVRDFRGVGVEKKDASKAQRPQRQNQAATNAARVKIYPTLVPPAIESRRPRLMAVYTRPQQHSRQHLPTRHDSFILPGFVPFPEGAWDRPRS